MMYLHAALILHEAGKEINEENMKKLLSALDIELDEGMIRAVVKALDGVNIEEAIKSAEVMVAAPAASAGGEAKEEKKEEAKEEKKEEKKKSSEDAVAGLAALFG